MREEPLSDFTGTAYRSAPYKGPVFRFGRLSFSLSYSFGRQRRFQGRGRGRGRGEGRGRGGGVGVGVGVGVGRCAWPQAAAHPSVTIRPYLQARATFDCCMFALPYLCATICDYM